MRSAMLTADTGVASRITLAASLVALITGSGFYTGTLHTEIGAHLSRLGACNAETLTTNSDCAVLAWLSL